MKLVLYWVFNLIFNLLQHETIMPHISSNDGKVYDDDDADFETTDCIVVMLHICLQLARQVYQFVHKQLVQHFIATYHCLGRCGMLLT